MADKAEGPQPTASEAMFFFSIVKNMKSMAEIDWIGVAEDRGFKSAEVAKVRFGQVKRKLGIAADVSKVTTPKKSGAGFFGSTPTKVTKTATGRTGTKGKKNNKVKQEDDDDDDDDDDEEQKGTIKKEDDDAETQLQADIHAMVTTP